MMCIDCLYWQRNVEHPWYPDRGTKFGECFCDQFIYTGDGQFDFPFKGDELLYWDSEGYSASFITGENFGCIHFLEVRK